MGIQEILTNIKERLGIATLNEMQRAVAGNASLRNLVLTAPTGSGKTLALAIAMLRRINPADKGTVQAVVIVPTRELALQWLDVVRPIAVGCKSVVLYGGHSFREEAASLSVTPAIVIATPGRLLDHQQRDRLDISTAGTVVLDEYDKLLDLGFAADVARIVGDTSPRRCLLLSSATDCDVPKALFGRGEVTRLDFGGDDASSPASRLTIARVESPERDKLGTLRDLLGAIDVDRVIVFVNHRESAERVYNDLHAGGFSAGLYHGGLEQQDRLNAFDLFNNGTTRVLVSTDLAARGIDIDGVDAVVHYHLPPTGQVWIHRNGRTARFDATGMVYVITSEGENIPQYVTWEHDFVPSPFTGRPRRSSTATLYFNIGKKDKISRGDIVGFLISKGGLTADEIGSISLRDHAALVAVPSAKVDDLVKVLAPHRIKNKRARITLIPNS